MVCFAGMHYNEEKWLVYAPCFYFFISRLLCNLIRAVYNKSRKNIQNTKKGYHNIYITAYSINFKVHIISTEGLKLITFGAQWLETKFWFQNGKSYLQILTNMEEKSLVFHLQK